MQDQVGIVYNRPACPGLKPESPRSADRMHQPRRPVLRYLAGRSDIRRRIRRAAQVAAQPSGTNRPGRNTRPALASSPAAGCRAPLSNRSGTFTGRRRSRIRPARSWARRWGTARTVGDRTAARITLRVSGSVTRRRRRASLRAFTEMTADPGSWGRLNGQTHPTQAPRARSATRTRSRDP